MGISLLTPTAVIDERKEEQVASQRRAIGFADEENRIIQSLNLTRSAAEEQMAEISGSLIQYQNSVNKRRDEITEQLRVEERRVSVAKSSVEYIKKEADIKLLEAEKAAEETNRILEEVRTKNASTIAREVAATEREKKCTNREQVLVPKEQKLEEREKNIAVRELAFETARIAHENKMRRDDEFAATRKFRIDVDGKTNETERNRLEDRERRLEENEKSFKVRAELLDQSFKEINSKKLS